MSNAPRKIFISYRRNDEQDFIERIRDWFIQRYGRENVFMDFDSIPPFTKFADYIREKVDETDVMVVIIGPKWVELLQERAKSFQDDYVRIEVSMALQKDKVIAPICIKGAGVPARNLLPSDLQPLLDHNMAFLNSGSPFLENIGKIVDAVEQEWGKRKNDFILSSRQAWRCYNSAKQLFEEGNYDFAIIYGQEAINHNPQFAEAYNILTAALNASAFIDRSGGDPYDLYDAYDETNDKDILIDIHNLEGIIECANQAVNLNPNNATAYNNRGDAHYNIGDFDNAIADYTEAIRITPWDAEIYCNRAQAHRLKGDTEAAISDYNEAICLTPHDAHTYLSRAKVHKLKGDLDAAISDYNETIRLEPQSAWFYKQRAEFLEEQEKYTQAIADYEKYLELDINESSLMVDYKERIRTHINDLKKKL
jgi:tetratricopeptide (TPR) repeat protein